MTANDPQDIEKTLLSVSPKAVPPGLRERILEFAVRKQRELVMTPRTWAAAASCAALIAIAVLGDAAITRAQNNGLRALLSGRSASRPIIDDAGPLQAEIRGEVGDFEKPGLVRMALARPAMQRASLLDVLEARERLKGWLDHEDDGPESPY